MFTRETDPWWQRAACGGRDPAWWSADHRPMWPAAVRVCLSCPVRQSCLDDAVAQHDSGVIRGGMLLVETARGRTVVPLICAHCGLRPVRHTDSGGVPRYCGRACQAASNRRRSATRTRPAAPAPAPAPAAPAGAAPVPAAPAAA